MSYKEVLLIDITINIKAIYSTTLAVPQIVFAKKVQLPAFHELGNTFIKYVNNHHDMHIWETVIALLDFWGLV